jgi:predicted nucleotidyltransferase
MNKKYNEIMMRIQEHYNEALEHFEESHIVGIWLQGSQNYGLDLPTSDIDTKLIVTPSFKDIALAAKPVSTTHIRENNEHIDFKDIRLYIETFRKQNLNFLEILFTPYYIINPLYKKEWDKLVEHREDIARMNPKRAIQSMKGIALEKYFAMEHRYPSKVEVIDKYGYDGKQVHHLLRIDDFLERYIAGETYEKCLIPTLSKRNHLMDYKKQLISLEEARIEAEKALAHITEITNYFYNIIENEESYEMRNLLEEVSYNIMRISVQKELGQNNIII